MSDEDEGLLDQTREQTDRSTDGADLEVAEAAALKSAEVYILEGISAEREELKRKD